jgi:predicted membrane-bound spermidine synthase
MALLIRSGLVGGLLTTGLLMLASGFLVAALFAYASLRRQPDQRSIVSPLYSADLLGGCAGSVLASLLLIPMLGLPASAVLMAALVLLALTLI